MKWTIFFCFLFGLSAFAQQPPAEDLKVGLVLSGGGAKGLAHIGALKVIEESGVEIDYIAGSSMGAIVGSLYASGYNSQQLDSIFHEIDFNKLIQDDLPRNVKTFYEKEQSERYAVSLPFDNFKVSFPSGLSKGQNIYNLLAQLTAHLGEMENFEEMPIPFFCTGTNIETGEEIILDHGSLPQAVSASGAIPSLFSPVYIEGTLITDGGVSNNYPVEELRKRGAEYIIGVDVQDSLVGRKDLQTAFEIITQINNFRTINDMRSKRKLTDLYIKPDITNFSILSFDEGEAIIEKGEEGAQKKFAALQQIAQQQKRDTISKRPKVQLQDSIAIDQIEIKGNTNYPRNYIRGKLQIPTSEKIAYKDLNRGINNLSATGNFKRVEYKLIPTENGKNNLRLIVHENQNNTNLRVGIHHDDLYRGALLANLTRKSLLLKNDITSLDLIVGENFRYSFQYYIDKGNYYSIGVNSQSNRFEHDVGFDFLRQNTNIGDYDVNKVEIAYSDFTNQFFVETFLQKAFKIGVGVEHKYTNLETETIIEEENSNQQIPITILEQSNLFGTYGYLEYDTYDNAYFPRKGARFNGIFQLYLFESHASFEFSEFSITKGSLGYAFSPLPKFAIRANAETGFRIGNTDMSTLNFFLGGYGNHYVNNITPFLGYDYMGISGNSYIKSLVEFDYEIFRKNHLIASYNVANVEDDLYETGNWLSTPDYTGFALGYGIETFLGPIELKYSYTPEQDISHWFFSLGFWF